MNIENVKNSLSSIEILKKMNFHQKLAILYGLFINLAYGIY